MRIIHGIAAIAIALIANSIESIWLGLLALIVMLAIYTFIAVWWTKRNQHK